MSLLILGLAPPARQISTTTWYQKVMDMNRNLPIGVNQFFVMCSRSYGRTGFLIFDDICHTMSYDLMHDICHAMSYVMPCHMSYHVICHTMSYVIR